MMRHHRQFSHTTPTLCQHPLCNKTRSANKPTLPVCVFLSTLYTQDSLHLVEHTHVFIEYPAEKHLELQTKVSVGVPHMDADILRLCTTVFFSFFFLYVIFF